MNPLGRIRRAPWLSGAVVLVLAVLLLAPAVYAFGIQRWPFYLGLLAVVLLAFGALERAWQGRRLPRLPRGWRRKLKLVPPRKGNGHAHDLEPGGPDDKPRWIM